jgi:hypothetical protein
MYHGGQLYWWRKPEYLEKVIVVTSLIRKFFGMIIAAKQFC